MKNKVLIASKSIGSRFDDLPDIVTPSKPLYNYHLNHQLLPPIHTHNINIQPMSLLSIYF